MSRNSESGLSKTSGTVLDCVSSELMPLLECLFLNREPETVPRDLASPWVWWLSPDVSLADEDVTKVTGLVQWR